MKQSNTCWCVCRRRSRRLVQRWLLCWRSRQTQTLGWWGRRWRRLKMACMPVTCVTKSSRRAARCFDINMNTQVRFCFFVFFIHACKDQLIPLLIKTQNLTQNGFKSETLPEEFKLQHYGYILQIYCNSRRVWWIFPFSLGTQCVTLESVSNFLSFWEHKISVKSRAAHISLFRYWAKSQQPTS